MTISRRSLVTGVAAVTAAAALPRRALAARPAITVYKGAT
jgi:hypothetical protein